MPPMAPTTPVVWTHAAHHLANSATQPCMESALTRMKVRNAKGRSGIGRREAIADTVGYVLRSCVRCSSAYSARVTGARVSESAVGGVGSRAGRRSLVSCNSMLSLFFPPIVTTSSPGARSPTRTSVPALAVAGGTLWNSDCIERWRDQSHHTSCASMMHAGGTVISQTGTPTVLVPTRTPRVARMRQLPNIAPPLSTSVLYAPKENKFTCG